MKTVLSSTQVSARWVKPLALALLLIFMVPLAHSDPGADEVGASDARTVLITGANRGLGLELSRQYSVAGWRVIGTARKPGSAQELAALGQESVLGIRRVIDGLAEADNGAFFSFEGERMPW